MRPSGRDHKAETMQQLLWIETLLKFAGGMVLVLTPLTAIKVLGLPRTDSGFWPRLLGSVLIGLAAATFLEGRFQGATRGLGVAGCLLVNTASTALLVSQLVLGGAQQSQRGQAVLWLLVLTLVTLIVVEIAHV